MEFLTTQDAVAAAVARGIVKPPEAEAWRAYLNAYDEGVDGRVDGGFSRAQFPRTLAMSVDHHLAQDVARTGQVHRLIQSLFRGADAPQPRTMREAGASTPSLLAMDTRFLAAPFLGLALLSGCDNTTDSCYDPQTGDCTSSCHEDKCQIDIGQPQYTCCVPNDTGTGNGGGGDWSPPGA